MTFLNLALIVQVLVWFLVLEVYLVSGQSSIFHPLTFYLGFHLLVFVIRPLCVHLLHFDTVLNYMLIDPPESVFIRALFISSFALLVFSATVLLVGRAKPGAPLPRASDFTSPQMASLALTSLLLAPLAAYSILAARSGLVSGENRGAVYVMTGVSGYTAEAQNMIGPLLCAWLAATRFKWQGIAPLAIFIGYRAYCGWSRWTIILLFVALAMVYAWQKRIRWLPVWAVVLALPIYMLFNNLGRNRDFIGDFLNGTPSQVASTGENLTEKLKQKYDVQEFANYDYLVYVVRAVPNLSETYTYGTQYLQLFTEPIPRKLWPDKPIGAPVSLVPLGAYGNFMGLTVSLPGDGWLSGGYLGVLITMGLAGAFFGFAHKWFWDYHANNFVALFYLMGLSTSIQWFRDGGISISKFLLWTWLPLILWAIICWILNGMRVPSSTILLRPGTRVRVVTADNRMANGGGLPVANSRLNAERS